MTGASSVTGSAAAGASGFDPFVFAVITDDDTLALVAGSQWVPKLKTMADEWYGSADLEKRITRDVLRVTHEGISIAP